MQDFYHFYRLLFFVAISFKLSVLEMDWKASIMMCNGFLN